MYNAKYLSVNMPLDQWANVPLAKSCMYCVLFIVAHIQIWIVWDRCGGKVYNLAFVFSAYNNGSVISFDRNQINGFH